MMLSKSFKNRVPMSTTTTNNNNNNNNNNNKITMLKKLNAVINHKYFHLVMLISVIAYVATKILAPSLSNIFRLLFLAGSISIFFIERKRLFKDPMIILLLLSLVVQILSWLNSLLYLVDLITPIPKIDKLAKLFNFIFMAYWLKGNIRNVYYLWGAFAIGIVIACFNSPNFLNEIELAMSGKRIDFGLRNAQFTSMFAGTILILAVFYLVKFLFITKQTRSTGNILILIGLSLSSILFAFIVAVTQTRQIWLGLVFVLFCSPLISAFIYRRINVKFIILIYTILAGSIVFVFQTPIVAKRLSTETETYQSILSGNLDNLPYSSTGIRIHTWQAAFEWIKERPIFGSGSNARSLVIARSDKLPENIKARFGHLHNYHIETLLSYGVFGCLVIYGLYYWNIRSLYKERGHFLEGNEMLFLSIIFTLYWLIINNFESFNSFSSGILTHNVMLAGFYTFYLTESLAQKRSSKCV
jgi:O-antigen ligase